MRDCSFSAVVKSSVSNLTFIKIIFFIVSILTVNNVVINILIFPLLPILLVLVVVVNIFHRCNYVVPMTGVTFFRILLSAWIGWVKTGSFWAHSLYIALILAIIWVGTTQIEV